MILSDARSLIITLVKDDAAKLTIPDDYDAALKKALAHYSQFRPDITSQTVACGANGKILTSLITGFDEGFVDQMMIEYPIITSVGRPYWLDNDDWSFEQENAGPTIRFVEVIPAEGQNVRFVHRIPHVLPADDANELTVRKSDCEAVCEWAANEALLILAALFTGTVSTFPQANFAVFGSLSSSYETRAEKHRKAFYDHLNAAGRREYSEVALVRG